MTPVREELLHLLEELSNRYPDWRFGQLVANVSYWAREPRAEAIWDVEDEELLKGIKAHLSRLEARAGQQLGDGALSSSDDQASAVTEKNGKDDQDPGLRTR